MFKPVKITSAEIEKLLLDGTANDNYSELYDELTKKLKSNLTEAIIKQTVVDGTRLQEEWFPQDIGHFDVFISHSHRDLKLVKQFSYWLHKNLSLRCFVDSVFWKYSDKLLEKIDYEYSRYYDKAAHKYMYYYSKRNITTSNIHCMLTMALMKMMECCELVIFIDSNNSIKYEKDSKKTPSPWIYEEIEMANMLPSKMPKRWIDNPKVAILNESELKMFTKAVEDSSFFYDARIDRFSVLNSSILKHVKERYSYEIPIADNSLDEIYRRLKNAQGERFFIK
jgi:hypothetical protein